VFLAEDDADDQEMLIEMMKAEDERLRFLTATTGSKAVDMLKKVADDELPCLVVLDYNLPEMSGAEILAKLADEPRYKEIVKVVWSTSNSPVYQKKCMELGAHSYIVKPTGIAGIKDIAKQLTALCLKTPH
jgi:CheY-like chemotaxis protein